MRADGTFSASTGCGDAASTWELEALEGSGLVAAFPEHVSAGPGGLLRIGSDTDAAPVCTDEQTNPSIDYDTEHYLSFLSPDRFLFVPVDRLRSGEPPQTLLRFYRVEATTPL